MEVESKQVILKDYVNGFPKESDMETRSIRLKLKLPADGEGQILVKNLYLSCDPYMRNRMNKIEGSYVDSFTPGSPITGYGVAKVLESSHPTYEKGDLLWGFTSWEDYSYDAQVRHLKTSHVPGTYQVRVRYRYGLGTYQNPMLTNWYGQRGTGTVVGGLVRSRYEVVRDWYGQGTIRVCFGLFLGLWGLIIKPLSYASSSYPLCAEAKAKTKLISHHTLPPTHPLRASSAPAPTPLTVHPPTLLWWLTSHTS